MSCEPLDTGIGSIKGVGEARSKLFAKLGVRTLRDLVAYFPRGYEDRTQFKSINGLTPGETVCVRAVAAETPKFTRVRKGMDLVKFRAADDTGVLDVTFFNQRFVKDAIKSGESYVFYGKIDGTFLKPAMSNPHFEPDSKAGGVAGDKEEDKAGDGKAGDKEEDKAGDGKAGDGKAGDKEEDKAGDMTVDETGDGTPSCANARQRTTASPASNLTGCIVPVYGLTSGLSGKIVMNAVRKALDINADGIPDALPESAVRKHQLCPARFAYENIHFPIDMQALESARERLIFEELFVLAAAMRLLRARRGGKSGRRLETPDFGELYRALPFQPTGAQMRAVGEAAGDMASGMPMNRLVQGDVGSGKTLVAAACCFMVWRSGCQSAFMAPTEILAKQHFRILSDLLEPQGMRTELLVGSMTQKRKREVYDRLSLGEIDLVIGTHALISEGVEFRDLALVITDEQHRFGVNQRTMLTEKGDSPHVLVMSATPIPRTLSLIIYGDLDVSVIDEMPPGRRPVETFVVGEQYRLRINDFIRKLVGEGRQVFIVCPMVEESQGDGENRGDGENQGDGENRGDESAGAFGPHTWRVRNNGIESGAPEFDSATGAPASDVKSATEYSEKLQKETFPDLRVALVHGKMHTKEKDAAMSAFADGEADILVATTVVEVGVDVPNAALMIVENADRFGLSQLHQLRGRVGRGEHTSYCVLFRGADGSISRDRLDIMRSTNDGFKIAEEDLKQRGPGDFFGSRQHGLPEMRIASLTSDMAALSRAASAADETVRADPELKAPENRRLAEQISRLFEINADRLN